MTSKQAVVDVTEIKVIPTTKSNSVAVWCALQWRAILAELVSTMFLVLFGCMGCIHIDGILIKPIYGSISFGLTVLINIQIFGHLSGAYMNPAVTLAAVIWGSISIPTGIAYFIVQCLGAILGYGILIGVAPGDVSRDGICLTMPTLGINEIQALAIEICLTASLIFINCGVWDPVNKEKQDSVPIKFGLSIIGLSIIGGPLTDASMNPARTLGPAVWTGAWTSHWVYWVGPLLGSIIATPFYKLIWLKRDDKPSYYKY